MRKFEWEKNIKLCAWHHQFAIYTSTHIYIYTYTYVDRLLLHLHLFAAQFMDEKVKV